MENKEYGYIETGGIQYCAVLEGADGWYWGMDYTSGDLYEAEELYREGHPIRKNRLIFLHFPEGAVLEPLRAEDGQYLGQPVFYEGDLCFPLVDFAGETITVFALPAAEALTAAGAPNEAAAAGAALPLRELVRLPLSSVKDCYNLRLTVSPLTLVRQGHANDFQLVWPEKGDFAISPAESLDSRDGDVLLFSEWFEDPDYREETVVRRIPDGAVIKRHPGSLFTAPDGVKWILK